MHRSQGRLSRGHLLQKCPSGAWKHGAAAPLLALHSNWPNRAAQVLAKRPSGPTRVSRVNAADCHGPLNVVQFSIFVLVELAWGNAGKRTGSSNNERPHNSSAGQVRSGPVSAPGAAVMSRLQFTTGSGTAVDVPAFRLGGISVG